MGYTSVLPNFNIVSWFVNSHPGQLSLLPIMEWRISAGQNGCEVKTDMAYFDLLIKRAINRQKCMIPR